MYFCKFIFKIENILMYYCYVILLEIINVKNHKNEQISNV